MVSKAEGASGQDALPSVRRAVSGHRAGWTVSGPDDDYLTTLRENWAKCMCLKCRLRLNKQTNKQTYCSKSIKTHSGKTGLVC